MKRTRLKIDWVTLEEAFDSPPDELPAYLDRVTGRLVIISTLRVCKNRSIQTQPRARVRQEPTAKVDSGQSRGNCIWCLRLGVA